VQIVRSCNLQLWILSREIKDLDLAKQLGIGIKDARIRDAFLVSLVDVLLVNGLFNQAAAMTRKIGCPSLRGKTLRSNQYFVAQQREARVRREAVRAIVVVAKRRSLLPAWCHAGI
jgi:hypothetical protein